MNKERELLKKIWEDLDGDRDNYNLLCEEIEELLAQPEQTEQEPVGIVTTIGGYPDDSEHTVKLACRHGDIKNGDLLYTSPQKREPLSEDKLDVLAEARITDEGFAGYYAGFRDAEKHHGITGATK